MEFRNLTPFAVMNYSMLDVEDTEHHVAVMKIGYQLLPAGLGEYSAELLPAPPLCLQDEYRGLMNASQVLQESDLAPFKPRCDVIVNGTAYPPDGRPCSEFPVRLQVKTQQGQALLDKTLTITGEREFIRDTGGNWQLTEPKPFTTLPLDYRYAFGGECKIQADEKASQYLKESDRLTPEQRQQHPDGEKAPMAQATCETNPLGTGFITPWYASAKQLTRYPAPRITQPDAPFTAQHFAAQLNGTLPPDTPACQPQGMGFIGRPWLPRRPLAGTYDADWLAHRHPYLPKDFDFGYWNGAPADQQIDWPETDIAITLSGLTPNGDLHVRLPGHRPFILLRMHNGMLLPVPMRLDTLIIDSEARTLHMTCRLSVKASLPIRVAEARFEINPDAPLLKLAPLDEEKRMADNYIARTAGTWMIVGMLPDVCKTPMGSSTPPIPYPVVAKLADSSVPEKTVRANGKPVVVFAQSFVPQTLGDQPGVANGVKSGTVGGKCHPKDHTRTVRAGNKLVLRHGDKFWMNGA